MKEWLDLQGRGGLGKGQIQQACEQRGLIISGGNFTEIIIVRLIDVAKQQLRVDSVGNLVLLRRTQVTFTGAQNICHDFGDVFFSFPARTKSQIWCILQKIKNKK